MGRILLLAGGLLVFAGLVLLLMGKLGLGRLPGDILIKRENLTIFFPITTMIILSLLLTLVLNLLRR